MLNPICFFLLFVRLSPRAPVTDFSNIDIPIPDAYDFLKEYPICDFGPLSQECGCCYAYGVIKAMSHRFCKLMNKSILLSSQYIVACDLVDNACVGGCERSVFYFMEQHGITDVDCHPWRSKKTYDASYCLKCSTNATYKVFKAEYASTTHYVGVENIKKAILLHGPVSASIACDRQFASYRGGIYTSSLIGKIEAGNHAVEIIGWGIEKNIEYWILLNQYGTHWGENGRMRIKMHSNEGLVESFVYGAMPKIE